MEYLKLYIEFSFFSLFMHLIRFSSGLDHFIHYALYASYDSEELPLLQTSVLLSFRIKWKTRKKKRTRTDRNGSNKSNRNELHQSTKNWIQLIYTMRCAVSLWYHLDWNARHWYLIKIFQSNSRDRPSQKKVELFKRHARLHKNEFRIEMTCVAWWIRLFFYTSSL